MNLTLKVWRQQNRSAAGRFETYEARDIPVNASFLEMLDIVNEGIISRNEEPIQFESDCREGVCGTCSMVINGYPHGGQDGTTVCQLYMRHFSEGDVVTVEPWRANPFPVMRDLIVDRSAFDRIIQAGGYVSVRTGSAAEANSLPVPKQNAELAMDAAQCIGCGACVAACRNASAMLFMSAKIGHLGYLPQGQAERSRRALAMVRQHDAEGFGSCTNQYECEAVCPKSISVAYIARMNRDFALASAKEIAGVE
jgi:succinate dehydrogenase / fumarate reductase iron-sulfur subunit